jgi:hypothetical protein
MLLSNNAPQKLASTSEASFFLLGWGDKFIALWKKTINAKVAKLHEEQVGILCIFLRVLRPNLRIFAFQNVFSMFSKNLVAFSYLIVCLLKVGIA